MSTIDLTNLQTERPPGALTESERSALILARARLRAMIDRRSRKLNDIAGELEQLRREMRELDSALDRLSEVGF